MKRKLETSNSWNRDRVVDKVDDKLETRSSTDETETGLLTSWKFDQQACRMALCEMIILDEFPFRFVEGEGFKRFVESLCPQFKIPSRHEIRVDCVKLFMEHKLKMKSFFQTKGMGRVSIITNSWTATNDTNFICVTACCIDKDWVLHKKIISFRKIYSHKGNHVGASIISSLEEWGLEKVLCCTMDNALANDGAIEYLKPFLERWNTSVAGGKYLHMPCVAHIINLVVSDGLEEIGLSVRRVREAVKWIKASQARFEGFKYIVQALKIDCTKSLCLDVPTRWNSTYLMLESAQPYAEAIKFFGRMNSDFIDDLNQIKYKDNPIGAPEELDWVNIRRMIIYLERFYDLTILVSGTMYVTSNLFFKEMCDVLDLINELEVHEDDEISKMAVKMKMKVGKYWLDDTKLNPRMNNILYIAALLDPRQKMKHVEKCLKIVFGDNQAAKLVGDVNNSLYELFDIYQRQMTPTPVTRANTYTSDYTNEPSDHQVCLHKSSCSLLPFATDEQADATDMLEITLYFMERRYKMTPDEVDDFDILQWWLKHGQRFPVLAEMARDILAIPISSVASEFAFSTVGRGLSQFRSSLTANMVEALICAEDWLKSSSTNIFIKDEEDVPEIELEKEFETALVGLDVGGGPARERTAESAQSQSAL